MYPGPQPPFIKSTLPTPYLSTPESDVVPEGQDLYHYTSVEALHSILGKNQLWATHAGYLNDSEEFSLGTRILFEELKTLADELKESSTTGPQGLSDFRPDLLYLMLSTFDPNCERPDAEEAGPYGSPHANLSRDEKLSLANRVLNALAPFVSCLTTHPDQLSQWRGYARGGYCIKFDPELLVSDLKQVDDNGDEYPKVLSVPRLQKVRYDVDEFRAETRSTIRTTLSDEFRDNTTGLEQSIFAVISLMFLEGARLKHHKFEEESEYRIILNSRETFTSPTVLGFTPRTALSFDPSAIKEIMVGPSEYAAARKLSLQRYLAFKASPDGINAGVPSVEVTVSEIPYREL